MENESKKMIKFTEVAKAYLVKNEDIIYKVLGRYQGEVSDTYSQSNGLMVATNKRLFFCNKRHFASFNYEKIINLDLSQKKLNRLVLTFQYNRNNITFTNTNDEKVINDLFILLSKPTYNKDINFSQVFKTTEIPIYNSVKQMKPVKPIVEESIRQIKETKCTCQACGKVWYYGKEEAFENFGNKLESFGNSMSNTGKDMMCCTGCLPALFIPEKQEKEVKDLNKCPECGSKAINKEVVIHNVK